VLEHFAAGQIHGGVAEALARLKRAAEAAG
jgi:hypothetical protein